MGMVASAPRRSVPPILEERLGFLVVLLLLISVPLFIFLSVLLYIFF